MKPELVCKVKYTDWTPDDRLRAPVFVGLRRTSSPPRPFANCRRSPAPTAEPLLAGTEGGDAPDRRPGAQVHQPEEALLPRDGVTKRDVLNYYDAVADLILPHLKDRPLSLKRYPNGIKERVLLPEGLRRELSRLAAHGADLLGAQQTPINYVFAEDHASLLYLVNLGCIDHNPWMSRSGTLDNPDFILIDLDPQECPFDMIVEAALMVTTC